MFSETHHGYPEHPKSVSEMVSEYPTLVQNPAPAEERQRKTSFNEAEEIEREVRNLRRRDEEDCRRKEHGARTRIEQHLHQNGGDLSYLLNQKNIPTEVRAVQLTGYGLGKNIHIAKVHIPLPLKHEVLIRAHSCGVNFHDVMTRNGMMDKWVRTLKTPFIMGSEVAGEVIGLGKNVTELNLGDRVMCLPERKAWSEYVTCHVEHCFKIPEEMSYNDAAALTVDGIVAYSLLFQMGSLSPGKAVLLHSTPGGLGSMVTQMVNTVPDTILFKIAMENEGQIKFSDQKVHYIDHDSDYVTEIRHSSPHGVDLVLDCQYEDNFLRDFNLLRPLGKYVLFGTQAVVNRGFFESARTWWSQDKMSPLNLYENNKGIAGFNLRNLLYYQKDRAYVREVFCRVCKMWQEGSIKPEYDCVIQFDDLNEVLSRMQEHGHVGKIVLNPRGSRESTEEEPDYYAIAEKIVKKRMWDQKPFLNKLGLPEPGELVRDKSLVEEEKERAKQQEQDEMKEKLQQQQQYHDREMQRKMMEQKQFQERETPTYEVRTTGEFSAEPPIVYDPSSGRTIYNVSASTAAGACPYVNQTQPAVSTTAATNVRTIPAAGLIKQPLTSTLTSTSTTEPMREAVLTKEKVELSIPMTKKEVEHLKDDIPTTVLEGDKYHQLGFMEKRTNE
jgi:NADPH:quinone reductase-like Zn-dependent oxidoreductase